MKKRKLRFKLFAAYCPKCGSAETRIDWLRPANLRRVPMAAVTEAVSPLPEVRSDIWMRCWHCGERFLG